MSKSARRCGAKRMSKSKCTKHSRVGALLEVVMSKKCTLLWRKAHVQVKMYKTHQVWNTFGSCDVEKCTALWREAHFEIESGKHSRVGALLEVVMSKKCTLLWRKAHVQVKMYKTQQGRRTFGS